MKDGCSSAAFSCLGLSIPSTNACPSSSAPVDLLCPPYNATWGEILPYPVNVWASALLNSPKFTAIIIRCKFLGYEEKEMLNSFPFHNRLC